jgi:signal transduction histidine kinase/CheY-like chemotaxis protein/HPt (histidine-containing phosphotransfer) domain-containing protein
MAALYMKRLTFKGKIGLLLVVAVILISATCFLSYLNLTSSVSSLQTQLTPELRLESIQNISRDIENAESSIRFYSVTRDTSDLRPYYSIVRGIDARINQLRAECARDTEMIFQIDTISILIGENIANWNQILYLAGNDYTDRMLSQLSNLAVEKSKADQEKNILKRVFSGSSRKAANEKALVDNIKKTELEEKKTREKLRDEESKLAASNSILHEKIIELISRMESKSAERIIEKGISANRLAQRTNKWILLFSISEGLLAVIVLYLIIKYLKHSYAYQAALERSKQEAEDLSRAKELFLANISHEIRTPVTAISGFTEQLLHEIKDLSTVKTLRIVKSSSDHLAKIIDDILDLSKLQNKKLELENIHFNLPQIMNEVNSIFEKQAAGNGTKLSYSILPGTPVVLLGDPYRLKQILINLVGNAVKFTEQGEVQFSVGSAKTNTGGVELLIKVSDTGIGIDESRMNIIFEDFTQAEMSTARKYGGTGLGLSIVRKLVELHGGQISCESRKNFGTTVICNLPYRTGDENKVKRDLSMPLVIPEELNNLNVLIVDDEEYNRLLFRKILERWKIRCDDAANGMDALEILKSKKYDIIFMDIRMPGIDGLKVARFIREELNLPENETQVVCISALSLSDIRDKYRKAGMNEFLHKPFTEEMLLTTIMSVRGISRYNKVNTSETSESDQKLPDKRINLANLFHISGGDNLFVRQMLVSFNNTTNSGILQMKNAITESQWESVAYQAHKMLPPCRHIGAKVMYALLEEIETGVQRNIPKEVLADLTDRLFSEFEAVSRLLEKEISSLN